MRFISLFLSLLIGSALFAQTDTVFNQTDAKNFKQGYWKKYYPNGKIMYKGFFKNDKPVGEMRRYFENGPLRAVLHYDANSEFAKAKLYYQDGKLAAEGKYFNALKDSTWVYYSFYDNSVTTRETYNKGQRNGYMINYFNNGDISEKVEWKNNKKWGPWEQYYQGNIIKLKAYYQDDKLNGEFVVFNMTGSPQISGQYKNDLREGKWMLFNDDGTVKTVLNYQSGKAAEEKILDARQLELFRLIDQAQGKYEEPDETDFLAPHNQ